MAVRDAGGEAREGFVVLWRKPHPRDGQLLVVDADLQIQTLFAQNDNRAVMSRVLLLDHGQVVLALHDELLIWVRLF